MAANARITVTLFFCCFAALLSLTVIVGMTGYIVN
jgi:hypothetical protein